MLFSHCVCVCLVAQSCPTLCDPTDCRMPGSSVHGNSPGKNTRVGFHALVQGIFPTQGSNPGLPHCRLNLYHLSYKEALTKRIQLFCYSTDCSLLGSSVHGISQARILEWVAIPSPEDLPNPGTKPDLRHWQAGSLPSEPKMKP